jgi:hypothetical protein
MLGSAVHLRTADPAWLELPPLPPPAFTRIGSPPRVAVGQIADGSGPARKEHGWRDVHH